MRASDMEKELRMAILTELNTPSKSKEPMTLDEELELYTEAWEDIDRTGCLAAMRYSGDVQEIMEIHMNPGEVAEFNAAWELVKHYTEMMDNIILSRKLELQDIEESLYEEHLKLILGHEDFRDDGGFEC